MGVVKTKVYLKKINQKHTKDIVRILNEDTILRESMNITGHETIRRFEKRNSLWRKRTNSLSFTIFLEQEIIGLISLSHINRKGTEARCGYWLASKFWGKGCATHAFEQILNIAKKMGIVQVCGSIALGNEASIKIWKKFGASFTKKGKEYEVKIKTKGGGNNELQRCI